MTTENKNNLNPSEPLPLTSKEMEAFMEGLTHFLSGEGSEDERLQKGLEIVKQEIEKPN